MPDGIIPSIECTWEGLSTKDIPRVQNVWTHRQRAYLCILYSWYANPKEEKCRVFNFIFEDELQRRGFSWGLPLRTFDTQWNDLRRKNYLVEKHVFSDIGTELGEAKSIIEDIAQVIGIRLVSKKPRRIKSDYILWPKPRSNDVQATSKNDAHLDKQAFQYGDDTNTSPATPVSPARRSSQHSCGQRVLRTPPPTPNNRSQQQHVREIPQLLFRAWNADSMGINSPEGFVAGMWASDPTASRNVSRLDPETFNKYARWHFEREKQATPFISVFVGLRAVVHRALRKHPASVTIFDMPAFPRDKITYGEDWVSEHPLSEEARKGQEYRGYGEYVVLGNIDQSYIVATFSTEQLEQIEEEDEEIASLLHLSIIRRYWTNRSELRKTSCCSKNREGSKIRDHSWASPVQAADTAQVR